MPTTRFPTASAVLRAARSQVGVTENPPGSNITRYGQDFGWPGVAWCGQFVWWCFDEAGVDLRRLGVPHPAFTPSFFAEAAKAGWVVEGDARIQPGDVLFFDFQPPFNTAGIQHVGLATSRPVGGKVHTIEGNTSSGTAGSQDNGGGVFERIRGLDVIVAAVRPPYAGASSSSAPRRRVAVRRAVAVTAVAGAVTAGGVAVAHTPSPPRVTPKPPTATAPHPKASPRPSPAATATRKPTPRPTTRPTRRPAPPAVQGVLVGPLRYGSTGESVRVLQRHLGVSPTGYFGRVTLRKVRAVQAAADIAGDGVVGPVTARAMGLPYVPGNRP